jgi:hypothetical protein
MDHIVHMVSQFDRFAVDLARGCLRAGDQEIDLRPKTFEKRELFEAAWPNVIVCRCAGVRRCGRSHRSP